MAVLYHCVICSEYSTVCTWDYNNPFHERYLLVVLPGFYLFAILRISALSEDDQVTDRGT